ncbi:MAG: PilN domain-containing protein [Acidobacteriaceae bacterium]
MRITVNLATRPYVELGPIVLRLRILMALLVLLAVGGLAATHMLERKLEAAQERLNAVHVRVLAFQNERLSNVKRMRQPANAAILTRADFLNALFLRKSFSWTAVMMDLETVLPEGVQVTSIEPEPTTDGDVMIHLRVSGDRDRAVQLVRNLERSKRFLEPRLVGEATEAKDLSQQGNRLGAGGMMAGPPPGVEFEILANYNPLPPGQLYDGQNGTAGKAHGVVQPGAKKKASLDAKGPSAAAKEPSKGRSAQGHAAERKLSGHVRRSRKSANGGTP